MLLASHGRSMKDSASPSVGGIARYRSIQREAGRRPFWRNCRAGASIGIFGDAAGTLTNSVIAIALTAIAPFARIARAPVLSLKERAFIEAGRALGFSHTRILFVHVLPNIVSEVLVMGSLWMATAVRTEASLSFIGLGVKPPTATWGGIIREGFDNIMDAPWISFYAGLAVLLTVFALNLLGDGLRDAVDPRLRGE